MSEDDRSMIEGAPALPQICQSWIFEENGGHYWRSNFTEGRRGPFPTEDEARESAKLAFLALAA